VDPPRASAHCCAGERADTFRATIATHDATVEEFDGLVLPGGVANVLVSSRKPGDLPAFDEKIVEVFSEAARFARAAGR